MDTNNNPIIIAVDTGNKLIKTVHTDFIAGLKTVSKSNAGQVDPFSHLRISGQDYVTSLERTEFQRNKTQNPTYLRLTLIAIARELYARGITPDKYNAVDIILSIGLPPGHLEDDEIVADYKNYFLSNGGVFRYFCGGMDHNIRILDVVICPQAYAVLLTLDAAIIKKPSLYLIDIGGGTSDTVHLIHGVNDNEPISLDFGVINMYGKIQRKLASKYGRHITEMQIDDILMRGITEYFEQAHIALVFEEADKHIKELMAKHKDSGVDLMSSYVVFFGGGSLLLKRHLMKIASKATGGFTVLSDIHANAVGFEMCAHSTAKPKDRLR